MAVSRPVGCGEALGWPLDNEKLRGDSSMLKVYFRLDQEKVGGCGSTLSWMISRGQSVFFNASAAPKHR